MADEYTPTSWVDGVPPYIDAEHLNRIEAELVRLGTQLAAIKAAYLGKSAISNVQVNDTNKVPSSALVYGMNENISELNSNFLTGKIPELLEDVLERFGLEIKNYTTDEFIKALPANTSIAFTHSETVGAHLTDLPDDYGVVQILKGYTANYCNATLYGNDGYTYKYYSNSSLSTKVNWMKYITKANIQHGRATVPITEANMVASMHVDFPISFSTTPSVTVTANSGVPGDVVKEVSVLNVSKTGFDVKVMRSDTTTQNVYWIAVGD